MKLHKILMLTALPLALTACAGSTPSIDGVQLDPPSEAVTRPCAGPMLLPDRELGQSEAETMWTRDRAALKTCRHRHRVLAGWAEAVSITVEGGR